MNTHESSPPSIRGGKVGVAASVLCALHCIALPVLLPFLSLSVFSFWANPLIEMLMILLVVIFSGNTLLHGYRHHHHKSYPVFILAAGVALMTIGILLETALFESAFLAAGALVVVSAQFINWRLYRRLAACHNHPAEKLFFGKKL